MKRLIWCGSLLVLASAPAAIADMGLTLDLAAALSHEPPKSAPAEATGTTDYFGQAPTGDARDHHWFATLGAGVARDGDDGTHGDMFLALSTFIAKELEFQIEFSGWYFSQPGDDTGGVGVAINARWHALHGAWGEGLSDAFDWSVFVDLGIGVILSGDDVPPGGTDGNLSPRVGVGATFRLGDSDKRVVAGVRWHHMSNARIFGDSNNPDFNAPMVYVGVQWPFGR